MGHGDDFPARAANENARPPRAGRLPVAVPSGAARRHLLVVLGVEVVGMRDVGIVGVLPVTLR